MKIGKYEIIKPLQTGTENADIFLVQGDDRQKYIIKQFTKAVKPYVGYSKKTHYGRRREGASLIFNEIRHCSDKHKFLIKFYNRFRWDGKWCIVLEYIEGDTLGSYLKENSSNKDLLVATVKKFAEEVKLWHKNNFAHGDPHLENVIIEKRTGNIRLIDYGQLHHPDFTCCQKFNCYVDNRRINQDLINDMSYFGRGFVKELEIAERKGSTDYSLGNVFLEKYHST